jgi:hypothetical protein
MAKKHLEWQRELVARLERIGGQSETLATARDLLHSMEGMQRIHIADRDRLREQLEWERDVWLDKARYARFTLHALRVLCPGT